MYSNKSLSSHILSLSLFCWQIETGASKARIRKKSHSQGWLNSSFIFFIRFLLALIKWSNDFLMVFVNRSSLAGRIAALAHIKKALIHSKQQKIGRFAYVYENFCGGVASMTQPNRKVQTGQDELMICRWDVWKATRVLSTVVWKWKFVSNSKHNRNCCGMESSKYVESEYSSTWTLGQYHMNKVIHFPINSLAFRANTYRTNEALKYLQDHWFSWKMFD